MKQKKPQTPREWALERVRLNCKVGRDAIEGVTEPIDGLPASDHALYCLLYAVEDLAVAIGEKE